jgi:hypothetical protein
MDNHDKTRKKSVWRLGVGVLLIAGASNSMRNLPNTMTTSHDPVYVIVYMGMCLLLAVIGLWLALSYLRRSN